MKRLISIIIFITLLSLPYKIFSQETDLSTETTETNQITNESLINESSSKLPKTTYKTLSPLVFEQTIIGTILPQTSSLATVDVRKYKKKGNSSDLIDYLQNIPDITTPTYYGSEGSLTTIFTPRGEKVNIQVNELDISTMANSSYDVNVLDPLFFNSLEIYYGPSSSRYGNGNYGGIVNFGLLGDEKINFLRVIRSIGTSFNTYYVMSDLSLKTEFGNFYLGISYNRSDNLFSFNISELYTNHSTLEPTNYTRQGAGYHKYSGLARFITTLFDVKIDTGILITLPTVNEPNQVKISNPLDYEKATSKVRFLLPYIKAKYSTEDINLGLKIYYTENLRNREVEKLISPWGGSIASKIYSSKFSAELEGQKTIEVLPENFISIGGSVNYSLNSYDVINTNLNTFPTTSTNESKTNASRNIVGTYIEANYVLSKLLTFTASSRFDYTINETFETSPRIGILVKPIDLVGIRSSIWRAYRLPYFDDIFGPIAYGYGTTPLTNLKTEYANGIDSTLFFEYKDKLNLHLGITVYYSDITNMIAFNSQTFSMENIGKVFTRGVNIQTKVNYNDLLTSLISYTYNESINGNASDLINWEKPVFLSHRPLNSLYIDIVYDRGYFGFGAYLNYQWNRFNYVYDSSFNVIGNRPLDDILVLSISHWVRPKDWVELGVEWKRIFIGNEYIEGYPIPEEKVNSYVIFTLGW